MKRSSILPLTLLLSPALQVLVVLVSEDGPFAHTIFGNKIIINEGIELVVDGIPQHYLSISCLVDPSYTDVGRI